MQDSFLRTKELQVKGSSKYSVRQRKDSTPQGTASEEHAYRDPSKRPHAKKASQRNPEGIFSGKHSQLETVEDLAQNPKPKCDK